MIKKCCGIVYAKKDKKCKVCGKKLVALNIEEIEETEAALDDDNENNISEAEIETEESDTEAKYNEALSYIENLPDTNEPMEDSEVDNNNDADGQDEDIDEKLDNQYEDDIEEPYVISNDAIRQDEITEAMAVFAELEEVREKERAKEKKKKEKKENSAHAGLKFVGITSIIVAAFGFLFMLMCVYFMIVSPTYDKTYYLKEKLDFPELSNDESYSELKPLIKDMEKINGYEAIDEEDDNNKDSDNETSVDMNVDDNAAAKEDDETTEMASDDEMNDVADDETDSFEDELEEE